MSSPLDTLIALLDLEPLEVNLFRGQSPKTSWGRVYGGQVLGQALVAAGRTVEPADRVAHSLHGYFLLGGDPGVPILYEVDRIRDGKSFTTRRVRAVQHGRAIFSMSASFHREERGLEHQFPMPEVPPPEELLSFEERIRELSRDRQIELEGWSVERLIEQRFVGPSYLDRRRPSPPHQQVWLRAHGRLPDDLRLHQCVLAYASDLSLLDTATFPHAVSYTEGNLQSASLDHAMWFHRRFRADEWLLYVQDSPAAAGARGFNRGTVYTREGALVASVAQEGLIRVRG
jgi:acyl-CoA thioesterase-2